MSERGNENGNAPQQSAPAQLHLARLTKAQREMRNRILNAREECDPPPRSERTRSRVKFARAVRAVQRLRLHELRRMPLEKRARLVAGYEDAALACRESGVSDRDRWPTSPIPARDLAKIIRRENRLIADEYPPASRIRLGSFWICPHCGGHVYRRDFFALGLRDPKRPHVVTCTWNSCGKEFGWSKPREASAWHTQRICLLCMKEFEIEKHHWFKQGYTCARCTAKRRDRRKYERRKAPRHG